MNNNNNKDWVKEFDNMFWKHRVPRNTKQSKDIKQFIAKELAKKDKELYLIEDALMEYLKQFSVGEGDNPEKEQTIEGLVQKLYSEFAELPKKL